MAIQVPVPTKAYASLLDTEGVPLAELLPLLGTETETQLANITAANQAALDTAFRVGGDQVSVGVHDRIRIAAVTSGGVQIAEWTVDIDDWRTLGARNEGNDLSTGGDNRAVTALSAVGSLLVGRSSRNRILIQRGTFTTSETGFFINAYARQYDGGLLERRISNLRPNPNRDTVLKKRSATEPAAPAGVTFDGNGYATPSDDGWIRATDADPPGTDPIWLAAAHNPYDPATETYNPEAWIITPGGSTFRQQWATDESGPWQDTVPADAARLVTRVRINGVWQVYVVRDETASGWNWFKATSLAPSGSPYTVQLDDTDWSDYKWIEFIMRQFTGTTQGNRRSVLVPADHVYSTGVTVNTNSAYTLNLLLTEIGGAWTMGATDAFSSLVVPNGLQQTFRIRFYGLEAARNHGTHMHITMGYTDDQVNFVMRGIK